MLLLARGAKTPHPFALCGCPEVGCPRFQLIHRKMQRTPWNKIFLRHHYEKRIPQNRAPKTGHPLFILSLNFTSLLTFARRFLFPLCQLFLPLLTRIEFLDFRHEESGKRINNRLRQLDFVWILAFFLTGHSVLPQQQDLSGSTQSFSRSFPAIQSQQTLAPCSVRAQMGFQRSGFLIELLLHPFPSGVFTRKAHTK